MPMDSRNADNRIMIRVMTVQDCEAVSKIEAVCFSDAWTCSMFEELFQYPTNYYLVAEMQGQIIGFAGSCISIDTADVMNIAVLEPWREAGIGGRLLSALAEKAEEAGCEKMLLEVRQSNQTARRFYQMYGFRELTVRRNYYSMPAEDAIIMCREL